MAKAITRKQAGVIYRAYKEGNVELTKEDISRIYDMADHGVSVWNQEKVFYAVKNAISFIFAGEYEYAQVSINNMLAA